MEDVTKTVLDKLDMKALGQILTDEIRLRVSPLPNGVSPSRLIMLCLANLSAASVVSADMQLQGATKNDLEAFEKGDFSRLETLAKLNEDTFLQMFRLFLFQTRLKGLASLLEDK